VGQLQAIELVETAQDVVRRADAGRVLDVESSSASETMAVANLTEVEDGCREACLRGPQPVQYRCESLGQPPLVEGLVWKTQKNGQWENPVGREA